MAMFTPLNNLPKRMYAQVALLDYCTVSSLTEKDIDELYRKIEKLKSMAFDEQGEAADKALQVVEEHDLLEIDSREKLKDRLRQIKERIGSDLAKCAETENISDNQLMVAGIMNEAGIKRDDAKKLAAAIFQKKLREPREVDKKNKNMSYADWLFNELAKNVKNLKEKLRESYNTYLSMCEQNPVVEQMAEKIVSAIQPNIDMYTVLPGNISKTEEYNTAKKDSELRQFVRTFFHDVGNPKDPEMPRSQFVKMFGCCVHNGMWQVKQGKSIDADYKEFCNIIEKNTNDNIDDILNISEKEKKGKSDSEKELLRKEKFNAFSRDAYIGMMAGILSKKREYDKEKANFTDYKLYVNTIETTFINKLKEGITDERALCFVEPEASNRDSDDTAEKQIISVHHKRPVGTVRNTCREMFGELGDKSARDITEYLESHRDDCARLCQAYHTFGNLMVVIGKEMHASLEANGKYELGLQKDTMVFATRINPDILKGMTGVLPDYLNNAFAELGNKKEAKLYLGFSDPQYLEEQRRKAFPGRTVTREEAKTASKLDIVKNIADRIRA